MSARREAVDAYDAAIFKEGKYRSARHHFGVGYDAGFEAAVKVFEDRFFGGPTKDMVCDWFEQARSDARDE